MNDDDEKVPSLERKKVKRRGTASVLPKLVDLSSLIALAQTGQMYQNIDTKMLWKILPQLIEINDLIGMTELKKTLFYQIIYYLQHLYQNGEYLHTIITGPPGTGKCLGKNTNVLLFNGQCKKVQDIQVGDLVKGDDEYPRKVVSTCEGREKMYLVENKGNESFSYRVNQSHILSLVDKTHTKFTDIQIVDYLQQYKKRMVDWRGYKVATFFPKKETTIHPYIAGYTLARIDTEHHILIENPLVKMLFQAYHVIEDEKTDYYKVNTEYFKENVEILNGRIPQTFIINDWETMQKFFAGIHDAIGIKKEEHSTILLENKEDFIPDLTYLIHRLGLDYHYSVSMIDIQEYSFSSQQYLSFPSKNPMLHTFTFYGKIPSIEYMLPPNHILSFPIHITELEEDEYYGFEIENEHSTTPHHFQLENGTITHNTTVAKIIGELYKNMGILSEDGIFKVATREDFVAEYLGQSAIKTKRLLESCDGGVLFIDEVYALGPGVKDKDSFSKEAIDTLNVYLSDHSATFCCIIAGYEEDIKKCFFSVNQGLKRRFQWIHRIDHYTPKELVEIFEKKVLESGWYFKIDKTELEKIITDHPFYFSNFGGDIENLISKTKIQHSFRILHETNPVRHVLIGQDVIRGVEMMKNIHQEEEEDESWKRIYC